MNGWCALLVLGLLGCGDDGGMPSADAPVLPKRPQWRDPALVMGITSSEDQGTPALRGDELELMFTQAAVGVGCSSFVRATRSSVTAAFAMPQAVTELNTAACEGSPTFGPDGRELFFVRGSGSAYKIFRAMRASLTDPFGTPTQVTELDIAAAQGSPSLTADGLVIVFTSGPMPGPAMNVYQAERASVSEPFGPPHQLAELGQVGGVALSATGDYLVTTSADFKNIVVHVRSSTSSPFAAGLAATEIVANPAFPALGQPTIARLSGDLYYTRRSDMNKTEIWRAIAAR